MSPVSLWKTHAAYSSWDECICINTHKSQNYNDEQVLKGYAQHNTVNVNLTHKQYNFWFMVYTHNIQYKNTNGEDASQQPSSREKEETRIKKAEGKEGFGYI